MLEARALRHEYGGRVVLDLAHFAVPRGAMVAIVGHNGSGKSTLLRLLALLERPSAGEVWLDGQPALRTAAARRRVTLVEQRPVLLHGSVRDNLAYGLTARGIGGGVARQIVETAAERLGIAALLERRRHELSDGEVQRVAVARALALRPEVLLLDEPTSSADRAAAQALFRALEAERRDRGAEALTICLASHQLEEAYRWADDIRALAEGRLSPVTPENLFRVDLPSGGPATKHARVGAVEIAVVTDRSGPAILAVPPTDIFVSTGSFPGASARNVFPGRVTRIARPRPAGAEVHVAADIGGGVELIAVITEEAARELALAPGMPVVYAFKASAVRVF